MRHAAHSIAFVKGLVRSLPGAIVAIGVLATGLSAQAATTTYTDRATFEASLPTGFYFNNFSTVPDALAAPVSTVTGSGGTPAVGYDITAPSGGLGVFPDAGFKAVGNWVSSDNVVVSFTTGNVASSGGQVWLSDINGNRLAGNVTVDFSNGSQLVVPSTTSGGFGFAGITTTDGPISTMTLQAVPGSFLNISNLSVAVVPEPGSIALVGLGAAGLIAACRRR